MTTRGLQIVDAGTLDARQLDPLLLEEIADWHQNLDWDFSKSAALVREFAAARTLSGAALLDGVEVAGYAYTGLDDHKGLIADLYVRPRWRSADTEALLFGVVIDALMRAPGVRRIESQLMLLDAVSAKAIARANPVGLFERLLMTLNANIPLPPGRSSTTQRFRIEPWGDQHCAAAATVIPLAYRGHIDSQINDHYRTIAGAESYLRSLLEFTGSAAYYGPASYIAFHLSTGLAAGISLSSFIAEDVGHIAEICVTPDARGAGLGSELLCQSIATLRGAGAKRVSLTVTSSNDEALRLYTRCGFREARRFYAYVREAA
jgi:ribosomal protein S18 acetylase RimI-like enzyme